ncbi:hypothetical protein AX777_23405 [Sphingobium yanoikuyae]|uniref:Uncharacterized protein n=1 Tax=Sphingobium yanoikuyae TaxID=13690 RepID=A0A177JAK3_SPHYA|nr:hypothetical protein AX777_23405 [Sphingobium yanoikuyae]
MIELCSIVVLRVLKNGIAGSESGLATYFGAFLDVRFMTGWQAGILVARFIDILSSIIAMCYLPFLISIS